MSAFINVSKTPSFSDQFLIATIRNSNEESSSLTVALLFASAYGNTAAIADALANGVNRTGIKVESLNCEFTNSKELIQTINKIFSYRRKTIQNIAKNFGTTVKSDGRLEDMDNNEIIKLAKKINRI